MTVRRERSTPRSTVAALARLGLAAIAALSLTSMAFGQTTGKVTTVWKCAAPNPVNAVPVGDTPDHVYVVQQGKCSAASGEIAGVKQKEGMPTEFVDAAGATAKGHGIFIETMANGDKIIYAYDFTGTSRNKMFESGTNTFMATSGTGRFAGIKSNGTCQAKGHPDGSTEFTCNGTYTLPK
ncbi:MAG: hypothetical protein ABIX28_12730 [Vicinamibacterales bacterium]